MIKSRILPRDFWGAFLCYKDRNVHSALVHNYLWRHLEIESATSLQRDTIRTPFSLRYRESGVQPVLLGTWSKYAKCIPYMNLTYRITGHFGTETDTFDIDGNVTRKSSYDHIDKQSFEDALLQFVGTYEQRSTCYASYKVVFDPDQDRLVVKRTTPSFTLSSYVPPVRIVTCSRISLINLDMPKFVIEVCCKANLSCYGLVRDLAKSLDSCAVVSGVERTTFGPFTVKHCLQFSDLYWKYIRKSLISNSKPFKDLAESIIASFDEEQLKSFHKGSYKV